MQLAQPPAIPQLAGPTASKVPDIPCSPVPMRTTTQAKKSDLPSTSGTQAVAAAMEGIVVTTPTANRVGSSDGCGVPIASSRVTQSVMVPGSDRTFRMMLICLSLKTKFHHNLTTMIMVKMVLIVSSYIKQRVYCSE